MLLLVSTACFLCVFSPGVFPRFTRAPFVLRVLICTFPLLAVNFFPFFPSSAYGSFTSPALFFSSSFIHKPFPSSHVFPSFFLASVLSFFSTSSLVLFTFLLLRLPSFHPFPSSPFLCLLPCHLSSLFPAPLPLFDLLLFRSTSPSPLFLSPPFPLTPLRCLPSAPPHPCVPAEEQSAGCSFVLDLTMWLPGSYRGTWFRQAPWNGPAKPCSMAETQERAISSHPLLPVTVRLCARASSRRHSAAVIPTVFGLAM